ncbi:MAG: rhodanese-like domain-containing protein [Spirochaetales bacterium]|nr:rhodanese-like domain-containing protein [Spirochaetales bacterium]
MVIFLGLSAAGLIAQGRRGQVGSATEDFGERVLSWEELAAMVAEADPDTYLVDVRTPEEFAAGAIPGAINIPHSRIGSAPPTADPSARIIVYCRSGGRSGAAKAVLEELGYTNVNNFGGIRRWEGELVRPR